MGWGHQAAPKRPQGCQNTPLNNITVLEGALLAQEKGKAKLLYLHPSELEALHKFQQFFGCVPSTFHEQLPATPNF